MFLPCVDKHNNKRQKLMQTILLELDESMPRWFPHASKPSGIHKHTLELRKSVPLGTILQNGTECKSGLIRFNDVAMNPEQKCRKEKN